MPIVHVSVPHGWFPCNNAKVPGIHTLRVFIFKQVVSSVHRFDIFETGINVNVGSIITRLLKIHANAMCKQYSPNTFAQCLHGDCLDSLQQRAKQLLMVHQF